MELETETITINGVEYVRKDQVAVPIALSKVVLVRTYSAGVHFGEMLTNNGKFTTLKNARRLWSWQGACSLSQVAVDGVDIANSKISIIVPEIQLTEAIEIIPMSEKAAKMMMEAAAWKK